MEAQLVKPDSDCMAGCVFPEGCDSSDPQGYQELLGGVGRSFLTFSLPPSISARPGFEFVGRGPVKFIVNFFLIFFYSIGFFNFCLIFLDLFMRKRRRWKNAAPRSCSPSSYRVGACPTAPVESQELLKPLSSQIDAHAILFILKL